MAKTSEKKQRGPGRPFQPGQSGNPAGRPKGSGTSGRIRAMLESNAEEVVAAVLAKALEGDATAQRLVLDRLCPPLRPVAEPFHLPLPRGGAKDADALLALSKAILAAVAGGRLTPDEGAALAGLVEQHRKLLETTDLEQRLASLEGKAP